MIHNDNNNKCVVISILIDIENYESAEASEMHVRQLALIGS